MAKTQLLHEELTRSVIGAFYEVYNTLGYGFLESLYVEALERELTARGVEVLREVSVLVQYKGEVIGRHRMDMIVDGVLVIEAKATEHLHSSSLRQVKTYLRATDLRLGMLLHFGPKAAFYRVLSPNRGIEQRKLSHP